MKTIITTLFLSLLTLQTSFAQDDVYDSSYNAGDYNNAPSTTNNTPNGDNKYYNNPADNSTSYTDEKGNTYITNNYLNDDYDYYYSSRIRRFHRPVVNYNYYDDYYVNRYWYNRYDAWGSIYDPIDSYWDWHFRPVVVLYSGWGNIYYGASWYNCWSWQNPWGYNAYAWNNNGWHHGWRNQSGWYGRSGWGSPYWHGYYDGYNNNNYHNNNWYSSSNPNSGTYYNGPRRNAVRATEVATNSGFVKPVVTTSGRKPITTEAKPNLNSNSNNNVPRKPVFEQNSNTNNKPKNVENVEMNENRPTPASRPTFEKPSKHTVNQYPNENPAPKPRNNQDKPKFDTDNFDAKPKGNNMPSEEREKPRFNMNNIERGNNNNAPSNSNNKSNNKPSHRR